MKANGVRTRCPHRPRALAAERGLGSCAPVCGPLRGKLCSARNEGNLETRASAQTSKFLIPISPRFKPAALIGAQPPVPHSAARTGVLVRVGVLGCFLCVFLMLFMALTQVNTAQAAIDFVVDRSCMHPHLFVRHDELVHTASH